MLKTNMAMRYFLNTDTVTKSSLSTSLQTICIFVVVNKRAAKDCFPLFHPLKQVLILLCERGTLQAIIMHFFAENK